MSIFQTLGRLALFRWLVIANGAGAVLLLLPFTAPVLLRQGWANVANAIYAAYELTCHEWPFRSYFLFGPQATYTFGELQASGIASIFDFRGSHELGFKVAFCERNVAICAGIVLVGLVYARLGTQLAGLSLRSYLLLITPMAIDGFTQILAWRESTWELRTITGLLFGGASVWLVYPRLAALVEAIGVSGRSRLADSGAT